MSKKSPFESLSEILTESDYPRHSVMCKEVAEEFLNIDLNKIEKGKLVIVTVHKNGDIEAKELNNQNQ